MHWDADGAEINWLMSAWGDGRGSRRVCLCVGAGGAAGVVVMCGCPNPFPAAREQRAGPHSKSSTGGALFIIHRGIGMTLLGHQSTVPSALQWLGSDVQIAGRPSMLEEYEGTFGGPKGPLGFPTTGRRRCRCCRRRCCYY